MGGKGSNGGTLELTVNITASGDKTTSITLPTPNGGKGGDGGDGMPSGGKGAAGGAGGTKGSASANIVAGERVTVSVLSGVNGANGTPGVDA